MDAMMKFPNLQVFKKKGLEVLMLMDHLDESCIQKPADYEGKESVSIQKANRYLNAEYKEVCEKLDVILLNCGMYKVEKEDLVDSSNKDIVSLDTAVGEYIAAIHHSQSVIDQQNSLLEKLHSNLDAHMLSCKRQIATIDAQIAIVQDDLNVVHTIIEAGEDACKATGLLQNKDADADAGADSEKADFTVRACAWANGRVQSVTKSTTLNRALLPLIT